MDYSYGKIARPCRPGEPLGLLGAAYSWVNQPYEAWAFTENPHQRELELLENDRSMLVLKYPGSWVAYGDGRFLGAAPTETDAETVARASVPDGPILVEWIPRPERSEMSAKND